MKEILIGIDNGNKFTKTHNELFLEETSIRPISDDYIAFGKTIIIVYMLLEKVEILWS